MKKLKKILLLTVGIYLLISTLFFIYNIAFELDEVYANGMHRYLQKRICFECAHGIRNDICPKINIINGETKTYPNAKEYNGEFGTKYDTYSLGLREVSQEKRDKVLVSLEESNEMENFIVSTISCGQNAWNDWEDQKNFIKKPEKIKIIFKMFLSSFFFIPYMLICPLIGCSM